ncbi:MAG: hypothetical protein IAE82_00855 [Opitutaceae bacterium]|nr:hypothetical protein [Opitutaceae bacterium]
MHLLRYLLGAVSLALVSSSAEAIPDSPRLFRLPVFRFTIDDQGGRWSHHGQLDSFGTFHLTDTSSVPESVSLPAQALNRNLTHEDAWIAYTRIGPNAVSNFRIEGEVFTIQVGGRFYAPVVVRDDARYDIGDLVNISARSVVTPGGDPLIGGFVIENQARRVLIRGVGPTLAGFGVAAPLPDPFIEVYRHRSNIVFLFNDDWNEHFDAAEIQQVSAQIGAFPLPDGSKDAAYLVELPPGAYTVHLTTFGATGGTGLLEIYVLPIE